MAQAPAGWIQDPKSPGWWYDPNGDAAQPSSWWQEPPEGFEYDPANPGWALRVGGDPQNQADWWHDSTVADTPAKTGLVQALDVASYQPTDLTAYIKQFGVGHVVVKLYQRVEGAQNQAHARLQIGSARVNGCTIGGYCWLYSTIDPAQQVADSLRLAADAGVTLPLLWLDVEKYTDGSCPNAAQIRAALAACEAQGVHGGIYSGRYVWQEIGDPSLPGVPLWSASYDDNPTLNTPVYGDMTLVGHQWTSTPLDRSVFDASVT